MALTNDFPILDGIAPSWADTTCKLTGTGLTLLEMKDIKAINSGRSLELGMQRGTTGRKMKTTTGQPDAEASIVLYRSGYQKMLRTLAAVAPIRGNEKLISLVHFNIQWLMTPPGDTEIYERRIKGCRVIGDTMNLAEGVDAAEVEVPLDVKVVADVIDGFEIVLL